MAAANLIDESGWRNNRLRRTLYFFLIVLPGFVIGYFSYVSIRNQFNEDIKERRLAVATLATAIIQERLTNIGNLGEAYANRPGLRTLVENGQWDAAASTLDEIRRNTKTIDNIVLTDLNGNLKAWIPEPDSTIHYNLAINDWYKGVVRQKGKPYISKVHKQLNPPYLNVITIAVPIVDNNGKPLALLGLQMQLEQFQAWNDLTKQKGIEDFSIVDQAGQIIYSNKYPAQGPIINHANTPAVKKIMQGKTGVERLVDPADKIEKLTAYAPIETIGWGVIVPQSVEAAYAERDQNLMLLLLVFGSIFILNNIFALLVIRNMVKLSTARKALRVSEERYKLAMEGANDGLWDWDITTDQVFFSPRWKSMIGYKEDEFPNTFEAWKDNVHPDDIERAEATIQAYFNHEMPIYELEHRLRHKNGTYRWILARGKALWDESDKPYRMLGFHTDLTERKELEEKSQEQQQFLNSIIDNIPNMIFVKDAVNLRFILHNKAGGELTGYPEKELLGKTDYDFFPKEQADFFVAKDREVLNSGKMLDIPLEEINSRFKGLRLLHTKKIPITDKNGVPKFLLGISEDVTEQKKAEEKIIHLNKQLEAQVKELERINQDLKDVTHSISHDLKAPLRGIEMLADWLLTDSFEKLDKEEVTNLKLMVDRVKRMRSLIDGILRYAKIGRTASEKEDIDLKNLLTEIEDMLAAPDTIEIITETNLPHLHAEKTPIMQVFQNLMSNAIKYMDKPKGQIRIGAKQESNFWKFYVADNGPGIEEAYFQKIFQIFQTLQPKDEFESTGIGLTIVKKIVENYGGRIWVESKQGEGSIFYFTLPEELVNQPEDVHATT